ncbi:hypothetical protein Clacol_004850 [Clathrus columnatus]|uniref:Uncharacterized protein n=1 Tax=Clathrus columnatus TaxID=1419009 RepID=A0AAV5AAX1_9AGAM|nr:hypothetical protein Clacol_004850 [Clathrus columnatus]
MLAFVVVIHQAWGLWKLKQSVGLQSNGDIVTLLLQQGTLRFCFALFTTTTQVFLSYFAPNLGDGFGPLQNVLSSLLLCEFALELRRHNTTNPVLIQSAINLPTLSFREKPVQSIRYAMGRLHESIVAEMGERNELVDLGHPDSGELDSPQDSHGTAIGATTDDK